MANVLITGADRGIGAALARLYQSRGDCKKARQNYEAALNLLERSEPDALVEPYGEMTACDMTHSVRAMLEGASA